jgi:NADH dehydrogenase
MCWLLVDLSDRLLPGLGERMSRTAERVLRRRGLEIRLGESIEHAGPDCLRMTSGE